MHDSLLPIYQFLKWQGQGVGIAAQLAIAQAEIIYELIFKNAHLSVAYHA